MTNAHAFAALAEPMRVAIVERLAERPMAVGELAAGLPVTRPAVSQHLKVLRDAGLVQEQRDGTRRIYSADARALGELRAYVDEMWHAALGRFAAAADKHEGKKR